MRRLSVDLSVGCIAAVVLTLLASSHASARIEAIQGKRYRLTRQHGPWMIMVASLHSGKEPTAEKAADELVYELRRKGIPAYVYAQNAEVDTIRTVDRYGRQQDRRYTAREDRICVIAGNYSRVDDRIAQKTLEYIKSLHPKSWKNHSIYRKTPGRSGPLSGAFLTINPMLSPQQVAQRKHDHLLARLNAGEEFSLLENSHKLTLVVATFTGKSKTQLASNIDKAERSFKVGSTLDAAAEDAQQLTRLLRSERARQMLQPQLLHLLNGSGFEAYVFHDRYRSIVSIGGFDTPNDPRIPELIALFGAKTRRNPQTGQNIMTGEIITIPGPRPGAPPLKTFLFDPYPRLMEVPRARR